MAIRTIPSKSTASAAWCEPVDEQSDLPTVGNNSGDIREVKDDGDGKAALYQWGGSSWVKIADPDTTGGALDSLQVNTSTLVANLSGYGDRVGIGTATPGHTVVVTANSGEEGLQVNGARNQYAASIRSSTQTGEGYGPYFRGGTNSSDAALTVDNADGTSNYLKIRGDGNVGIGASDPDQALEVGGAIHVSGEVSSPSAPSSGDGGCVYVKSDGKLYYISDTVSETDISSGGGGSGTVTSITPAADSGSGSAITTSGTLTFTAGSNVSTSVSGTTVTIASTDQYSGTVTSITPAADSGTGSAITSSGTLTFTGGTGITSSVSGTTVTLAADNNGTVTSITPGADSGSGTAITASGTLTVAGTSNEIATSVSGTTITVGLPSAIQVSSSMTAGDTIASAKDLDGDFAGLTLTNHSDASDTTGKVSIQFNLNDTDDDRNLPAGKIQIVKEQAWTSDNTTHDASMRFELAENGTQAEVMTLESDGDLSIDGDFKTSGGNIRDGSNNAMVASDGSGNLTLAAASKTTTLAGPIVMGQGKREKFTTIVGSVDATPTLDATYTWVNADVGTGGSATAMTVTLPRSSTVGSGFILYIQDFYFNATSTYKITVTADSNDQTGSGGIGIGGVDNSKEITTAGGNLWIISNGTNGWGIIDSNL